MVVYDMQLDVTVQLMKEDILFEAEKYIERLVEEFEEVKAKDKDCDGKKAIKIPICYIQVQDCYIILYVVTD